MAEQILPIIILNGRPAAGKSEVIDYLKKTPLEERIRRFHIGEFEEFDDFPILWERFEDDDIYQRHGKPRLISDTAFTYEGKTLDGYVFKDQFFWDFLIEKLNLFYAKRLRDAPDYHQTTTAILEFARGKQHGGFAEAYSYLSDDVLSKASTIYINVTPAQSRPPRQHPGALPGGQEDRVSVQGIRVGGVLRTGFRVPAGQGSQGALRGLREHAREDGQAGSTGRSSRGSLRQAVGTPSAELEMWPKVRGWSGGWSRD